MSVGVGALRSSMSYFLLFFWNVHVGMGASGGVGVEKKVYTWIFTKMDLSMSVICLAISRASMEKRIFLK